MTETLHKSAYVPSGASQVRRTRAGFTVRRWSVRNARLLEAVYNTFADALLRLHWLWNLIGYGRVERWILFIERRTKGFMFDCRMCGDCLLSDTGMSCPMNCPKGLRNGPCGGVRADGHCEVEPDMPCVWVEAWKGSQSMQQNGRIHKVQKPLDFSIRGSSAWLRATARKAEEKMQAK